MEKKIEDLRKELLEVEKRLNITIGVAAAVSSLTLGGLVLVLTGVIMHNH